MEDGFGLVFLCNAGIDKDLEKWIDSAVTAAFVGDALPVPPAASAEPMQPDPGEYAGEFRLARSNALGADGATLAFVVTQGHLFLKSEYGNVPYSTGGAQGVCLLCRAFPEQRPRGARRARLCAQRPANDVVVRGRRRGRRTARTFASRVVPDRRGGVQPRAVLASIPSSKAKRYGSLCPGCRFIAGIFHDRLIRARANALPTICDCGSSCMAASVSCVRSQSSIRRC
jgi:hypothetical protein